MKRSSQIALVLMGATAVGATAYAFTPPRRDCPPATATQAAPGTTALDRPPPQEPCRQPRRWWSGFGATSSGWSSSRSSWSRSPSSRSSTSTAFRPSTSSSSSPSSSRTSTSTTSRGGFGSTGRSFSSGS